MLLSSALETIIGEYVSFDAVTGSPIILRDQLDCAFFLNLYAVRIFVDWLFAYWLSFQTVRTMNPDPADGHAVCKPYIGSHTLALIDLVLFPTNDYPEKTPSSQIAYIVCFCWGKLLSWSWVTWADQRFVSAEIVCFIVSIFNAELWHVSSSVSRLGDGLKPSNAMQLAPNTENVSSPWVIC